MKNSQYEILSDNEGYFGKIPRLQGVWAKAETLENYRKELLKVLDESIINGFKTGAKLSDIDCIVPAVEKKSLNTSNRTNKTKNADILFLTIWFYRYLLRWRT
jgi:hypothetical protein